MGTERAEDPLGRHGYAPPVAVSLSGGGHRAALFGLGALWALSDLGFAQKVSSVSSVSGGSIASAYIGTRLNYRSSSGESFSKEAGSLAQNIARDWSIFRTQAVRVFLAAAIFFLFAVFAIVAFAGIPGWLDTIIVALAVAVVWWARWIPAGRHFHRILGEVPITCYSIREDSSDAHPSGWKSRRVEPFRTTTNHVLCATSLESGEHLYVSDRFVFAPFHGWAEPEDILWSDAAQASAALPGAFPPKWLKSSGLDFSEVRGMSPKGIPLYDGGVYDNLADQWPAGLADRLEEYVREEPALEIPHVLIAVNSSSALGAARRGQFRGPLLGEFSALARAKDVMYNNAAALRTQGLMGKFDRAALQLSTDEDLSTKEQARQLATKLRRAARNDREFVELIAEDNPDDLRQRITRTLHDAHMYRDELPALLELIREEMHIVPGELTKQGSLPMLGVVIEIDDSPFDIIHKYGETIHAWHWPDRAERAAIAQEVLHQHLEKPAESDAPRTFWARLVDENRRVPTTLSGLGHEVAGRLLYHAYVLTVVNAWVILGNALEEGDWIQDFAHAIPTLHTWQARAEPSG